MRGWREGAEGGNHSLFIFFMWLSFSFGGAISLPLQELCDCYSPQEDPLSVRRKSLIPRPRGLIIGLTSLINLCVCLGVCVCVCRKVFVHVSVFFKVIVCVISCFTDKNQLSLSVAAPR